MTREGGEGRTGSRKAAKEQKQDEAFGLAMTTRGAGYAMTPFPVANKVKQSRTARWIQEGMCLSHTTLIASKSRGRIDNGVSVEI